MSVCSSLLFKNETCVPDNTQKKKKKSFFLASSPRGLNFIASPLAEDLLPPFFHRILGVFLSFKNRRKKIEPEICSSRLASLFLSLKQRKHKTNISKENRRYLTPHSMPQRGLEVGTWEELFFGSFFSSLHPSGSLFTPRKGHASSFPLPFFSPFPLRRYHSTQIVYICSWRNACCGLWAMVDRLRSAFGDVSCGGGHNKQRRTLGGGSNVGGGLKVDVPERRNIYEYLRHGR